MSRFSVLVVLLFGFTDFSFASFPATVVPGVAQAAYSSGGFQSAVGEVASSCASVLDMTNSAQAAGGGNYYIRTFVGIRQSDYFCEIDVNTSGGGAFGPGFLAPINFSFSPATSSCPANSSGSSVCSCDVGFVEDASHTACISSAANDQAVVDGLNLVGAPLVGSGGGLLTCFAGVPVQASFSGTASVGGVSGETTYFGPFSVASGTCAANSTQPAGSELCGVGQAFGTVNGVGTCSPASTTNSVSSVTVAPPAGSASGSSSPAIAGAPVGTASQRSETICTGGSCETITVYLDSGGQSLGTETVTSPDSKKFEDPCLAEPDRIGCVNLGSGGVGDSLGSSSFSVGVQSVLFGSASGCPSSLAFDVLGHSYAVSYGPLCDQMGYLRALFLAMAAFGAAAILASSFKV